MLGSMKRALHTIGAGLVLLGFGGWVLAEAIGRFVGTDEIVVFGATVLVGVCVLVASRWASE